VQLGGETLLDRTVRIASEARLSPVIVVTRGDADFLAPAESGYILLVRNPEADEGMASSIRAGVNAAAQQGSDGTVVLTCDQPALRAQHLRALITDPAQVRASFYAGRAGVPAYFPAQNFPALLALRGDVGARDLLRSADTVTAEELALDIDTEDDLQRARKIFSSRN
jgi:CTP:molybdopterin cytidylyltransferase MocA